MSKEFELYNSNFKDVQEDIEYYYLRYDKVTEIKLNITSRTVNGILDQVFVDIFVTTYTDFQDDSTLVISTFRKYTKTYNKGCFKTTKATLKEIENSINQNNLDFEQLGFTLEGVEIYD